MKNNLFKIDMIRKLLILMITVSAFTACDDELLDVQPLDAISEDNVFTDPVFLQNYVFNIYNGIKPHWSPGTGGYIGMTDIAVSAPDTHDRATGIRQYLEGNNTPDNVTQLTNIWAEEYDFIRRANIFFEKVADSQIEEETLNRMKGEVHFLRAWMYFELIRTFGGVPLITNSFTLSDESFDVSRNSFEECAQFVLDECEIAIELLDGYPHAVGKVSQDAALGLKARMLLYMASP
ncbi:MAG: RagB/SusD family nutrient uptake outer membrane protein, partial [Anditalea sp.]